jgi:nitroimidazol reductase NimA-like FMN-containing flavoprotein (pyridoxamine 5'-phosphate oxidase superfamily)
MEKDLSNVRRKNREITSDAVIKHHLSHQPFAFIASSRNDQPFINSNLFYYDKAANIIYFHTARNSNTEKNFRENSKVCFSIALMGRLLPAKEATDFSSEYLSIVVFGEVSVVTDRAKVVEVLRAYFKKYFPNAYGNNTHFTEQEAMGPTVFAIKVNEWSCKGNLPDDPANAFRYRDVADGEYVKQMKNFW